MWIVGAVFLHLGMLTAPQAFQGNMIMTPIMQSLPSVVGLIWLVAIPGCLLTLLRQIIEGRTGKNRAGQPAQPVPALARQNRGEETLPYGLRDDFLTPCEFSFHQVLRSTLASEATIAVKVRLSDLLYVRERYKNQAALNRIHMKHVDFVVCDTSTMKPRLGIELDDSSHERRERQDRDDLVDRAFKAAGLPLLRVKAAGSYEPRDLRMQIEGALMSAA